MGSRCVAPTRSNRRKKGCTRYLSAGTLTDATVEALYEAGCDDMTFSECNGVIYADATREAPDFFAAAKSAIADIESVPSRPWMLATW